MSRRSLRRCDCRGYIQLARLTPPLPCHFDVGRPDISLESCRNGPAPKPYKWVTTSNSGPMNDNIVISLDKLTDIKRAKRYLASKASSYKSSAFHFRSLRPPSNSALPNYDHNWLDDFLGEQECIKPCACRVRHSLQASYMDSHAT